MGCAHFAHRFAVCAAFGSGNGAVAIGVLPLETGERGGRVFGLADRAVAIGVGVLAQQRSQVRAAATATSAHGHAIATTATAALSAFAAPVTTAFAALPAGTVENLLKPENKDQLAAILSYHVLPRELASNMLPGRTIHVKTIKQGGDTLLSVTKANGGVTVDEATVVSADIRADNGIIHVIDKVMLPSS